jgi:hypothetical protein
MHVGALRHWNFSGNYQMGTESESGEISTRLLLMGLEQFYDVT